MRHVLLSILCLVVACAAPPASEPDHALGDPSFWFCHQPGYDEPDNLEEWCELLRDAPPDRCPGLRRTCFGEAALAAPPPSGCQQSLRGGRGEGIAGSPEPNQAPPPEPQGCDQFDAEGLETLARWVSAILIAVLVLILLRVLWSTFGRPFRPTEAPGPVVVGVPEHEHLIDVPDLPSHDLLSAARRALSEGHAGEAVLLARGAALRHLGDIARLRLHRSRTDREYVRALRREPEAQRDLRDVVGAVEHHRWGGDPLGSDRAREALQAAERLVTLAAAALLLAVGLVSAVPAAAQTPERYAPEGDAALVEVLTNHGYEVSWRLRSLGDLDGTVDALIVDLTSLQPTDGQWEVVRRWVEDGGVLLVAGEARYLGDDYVAPVFPELGSRNRLDASTVARLAGPLVGVGVPAPIWPGAGALFAYDGGERWVELEPVAAPFVGPVLLPSGDVPPGVVVVAEIGLGVVVGIADPRLIWNGAFVHPANEAFVGELLYLGQGIRGWPLSSPTRVELATTASVMMPDDAGADNPLASMQNAHLALFVAQLLATWVLLGMWRGWPFAPLRDPREEGRHDFAEHVIALGTRWYRIGASRYALVQTARLWLERLGPSGLQRAAQRQGLSRLEAAAWVERIQHLVEHPEGADDPSDLDRMEELWKVTHRPG